MRKWNSVTYGHFGKSIIFFGITQNCSRLSHFRLRIHRLQKHWTQILIKIQIHCFNNRWRNICKYTISFLFDNIIFSFFFLYKWRWQHWRCWGMQCIRYKAVKLKWQKHYHSIAHKHIFTTLQNTILLRSQFWWMFLDNSILNFVDRVNELLFYINLSWF